MRDDRQLFWSISDFTDLRKNLHSLNLWNIFFWWSTVNDKNVELLKKKIAKIWPNVFFVCQKQRKNYSSVYISQKKIPETFCIAEKKIKVKNCQPMKHYSVYPSLNWTKNTLPLFWKSGRCFREWLWRVCYRNNTHKKTNTTRP